jgi:UDP-GlcNAc:undecaprenyl-phosphate GlcNAc-1-phosphate transferase
MQVFIVSLVSCLVLTFLFRGLAHHFGIVDHPGGRKQHTHCTPLVGGLAMFVAVLLALFTGIG